MKIITFASVSLACFLIGCSILTNNSTDDLTPTITTTTTIPVVYPDSGLISTSICAVCIGLNEVDPNKWGGWNGKLEDCEMDATNAAARLQSLGIKTTVLLTKAATIENCKNTLKAAITELGTNGLLIIWISGHGGRAAESANNSDEEDRFDEYLCLYDGPLMDDVISTWLEKVPIGIKILWICDTCHSGTMHRVAPVIFRVQAVSRVFKGQLILLSGSTESTYSYSTGKGGAWTIALLKSGPKNETPLSWYTRAKKVINQAEQKPCYVEYGDVSSDFRDRLIVK